MIKITWVDVGETAKNPSNPKYPAGIDIDLTRGAEDFCYKELPYPARRIGRYILRCTDCGLQARVTTAGRRDDPRSVKLPCKRRHD
jgi:hypothetical protein